MAGGEWKGCIPEATEERVTWKHSTGRSGKGCGIDGRVTDGRRSEIRISVEGIRLCCTSDSSNKKWDPARGEFIA
jgi:hypothetical protein